MPCEHCPHCQQIEAEKRAIEQLLAEQQVVKVENLEDNDAPQIPEVCDVYDHHKPVIQQIFNTWMDQKIHVIDGIAGGGKTYLIDVLAKMFKNVGVNYEFLSYSVIGSPSHKTIKKLMMEPFDKLTEIDVILIDNANRIPKSEVIELSEKLRRVQNSTALFGGKCVVFAVDFGMPLPYCKDNDQKSSQSLRCWISELEDQVVRHYLKHSGNGRDVFVEELRTADKIALDDNKNVLNHINLLIHFVYGELNGEEPYSGDSSKNGVILAPRKIHTDEINRKAMEKLRGESVELEAKFDGTIIRGDLDLHTITLKPNCIIILEQAYSGLPIGTRLIFKDADRKYLMCRVIDGPRAGENVEIGRVHLEKAASLFESQQPILQFPISLAFAITAYSAQGRRFTKVGVFKIHELWDHGSVYCALSRTDSLFGLKVLIESDSDNIVKTHFNKNFFDY